MIHLGKFKPGSKVRYAFGSFAGATGAPSATTGNATSDILIYKDGGTTERASAAGVVFTVDFDSKTGVNYVEIDLADNTTADFFANGSFYIVVIGDITIDGQTMRFPGFSFEIGLNDAILNTTIATLSSQTSFTLAVGPAEDNALVGCLAYVHDAASAVQCAMGYISAYTGSTKTVTLAVDPAIFTMAAKDNISILPRVAVYSVAGVAQTGRDIGASVLLSSGTGTGQLDFTTGVVKANVTQNGGSNITSASGVQEVKVASIAANAITATSIAADAITAAKVADGTIDAATFAAGAINAAAIAADAITAAKIADGAIDAATFAAGAINAAAIAADAITDAKVAADVTIASVTGAVGSVTGLTASDVGAIKAKTDNLPSDPADASDIAGAFSTVNGTLATIAAYIDTEIATLLSRLSSARAGYLDNLSGGAVALEASVQLLKVVTDKLHTMLEDAPGSPGESRYSADALVRAPTGSGGGGGGASAADIADAVWDEIASGHVGAGSFGALVAAIKAKTDNLPADPADASDIASALATIAGYLDTEVAAIKAKTDLIPAAPAAVGDVPTALENADALLNRDMSAVSDTNARTLLNAIRFLRNKWSISGTTLSVKKEDDATDAWTATVTAAPGADPISGNDPA